MSQNTETKIQNSILLTLGNRRDVMIWRNQVGKFRAMDDPQRIVSIGQPGAPDILSVVAVTITESMIGQTIGVAVGLEVKTYRQGSKQSAHQQAWQTAFEGRGGIYRVVRSPAEAEAVISELQAALLK